MCARGGLMVMMSVCNLTNIIVTVFSIQKKTVLLWQALIRLEDSRDVAGVNVAKQNCHPTAATA